METRLTACRSTVALGLLLGSSSVAVANWRTELVEGIAKIFKNAESKVHPPAPMPHSAPTPKAPFDAPVAPLGPGNLEPVVSGRDIAIVQGVRIGGKKIKEALGSNCSELRRIESGEEVLVASEDSVLFTNFPKTGSTISFELPPGVHSLVAVAVLEPRSSECWLQVMQADSGLPKTGFLFRQAKTNIYRLDRD
jgi:hypothetical protein